MPKRNQNAEKQACDLIDSALVASSWYVQSKKVTDFDSGRSIAVHESQTDITTTADMLLLNKKDVGLIKALLDVSPKRLFARKAIA